MAIKFLGYRDARVIWDHNTGRSKGYGFVSFRRKEDADAAIEKMQGKLIGSRRIRVGWAQHKQVCTGSQTHLPVTIIMTHYNFCAALLA